MAGRKFVLGEQSAKWLRQQMRMGPAAPMTRLTFRESQLPAEESFVPVIAEAVSGDQFASPANWRYRIIHYRTGDVLFEDVDPTQDPHRFRRPSQGQFQAAVAGIVTKPNEEDSESVDWVIWDLYELLSPSQCSEP